jgi:voltage-gated potassium channel
MDSRRRVEIPVHPPEDDHNNKAAAKPNSEAQRMEQILKKTEDNFRLRLIEMAEKPRRIWFLHWLAVFISAVSLAISVYWIVDINRQATPLWIWLDVGLCVFFALEFFTRSGFHWNRLQYSFTHFFDFIALIPVVTLAYYTVPHPYIWMWFILISRAGRAVDRILGDGFLRRNAFALAEGFEEEITDRVLLRIMERIQADLARGKFGTGISKALMNNKEAVLARVRAAHPHEGIVPNIARFTGLEAALERAEESTYDAIVQIIGSPEVDRAIRETVDSAFNTMRAEIAVKSWREHLGIKRGETKPPKTKIP